MEDPENVQANRNIPSFNDTRPSPSWWSVFSMPRKLLVQLSTLTYSSLKLPRWDLGWDRVVPEASGWPCNPDMMNACWSIHINVDEMEQWRHGSNRMQMVYASSISTTASKRNKKNKETIDSREKQKFQEGSQQRPLPLLSLAPCTPTSRFNRVKRQPSIQPSINFPQGFALHDKKYLVWDLDKTLLFRSFQTLPHSDLIVPVQVISDSIFLAPTCQLSVHVHLRPGMRELLRSMASKYEMIIFTASVQEVTEPILNQIDEMHLIQHRFYQTSCTMLENGHLVKDLSLLGVDLQNVILVDDNPEAFQFHRSNTIQCLPFTGDRQDRDLFRIQEILHHIHSHEDVRPYLAQYQHRFGDKSEVDHHTPRCPLATAV